MDISKVSSELGWQPLESLHTGLQKTIEWYLTNQDWVKHIQEESGYLDWIEENYNER